MATTWIPRRLTVLIVGALFLAPSLWAQEGDTSGSTGGGADIVGKFEFGVLGKLILPSKVPGADEVYPAIGPHLGLPLKFGTVELQLLYGWQTDSDGGGSNRLVYVPLAARFDFSDRGIPGYGLVGLHGMYYQTHDPNGARLTGADGGINFGGGLIFKDKAMRYRIDFRAYARPGWAVTIGFVGFISI